MGVWDRIKGALGGSETTSPEAAFREEVKRVAEGLPFVKEVVPDESDVWALAVTTTRDTKHTLFLGNLYAETREVEDREGRIEFFLRTLETRPEVEGWEEARSMLVPVIRAVTFASGIPGAHPPVARAFAPMLQEAVVLDLADSMAYVTEDRLEEWGVGPDDAFRAAREHLGSCVSDDDVEVYDGDGAGRIYYVARDDSYQVSRLALPGWLASFRGTVSGNPIAILPERSQLFVAGDADPETVLRLSEMAQREFESATRSISPAVYGVDGNGKVVPYVPPEGSPATESVLLGHMILNVAEYQTQKSVLEAAFEEDGTDIFVATFSAMQGKNGGPPFSYATWTEGVDTLLPVTDLVVFVWGDVGGEGEAFHAAVSWADVQKIAGSLLGEETYVPTRYRTLGWPDAEMLARLREHEAELG